MCDSKTLIIDTFKFSSSILLFPRQQEFLKYKQHYCPITELQHSVDAARTYLHSRVICKLTWASNTQFLDKFLTDVSQRAEHFIGYWLKSAHCNIEGWIFMTLLHLSNSTQQDQAPWRPLGITMPLLTWLTCSTAILFHCQTQTVSLIDFYLNIIECTIVFSHRLCKF